LFPAHRDNHAKRTNESYSNTETNQTTNQLAIKVLFLSKSPMVDRRPDGSSYFKAHAVHGAGDVNTQWVYRDR
jgi:hypothetical protein